jgi:7-cyano-7-deazaguanine synthase
MSNDLAIVLVSGGMDSLVVAAMAQKQHKDLAFLHLNYGQKTQQKEFECFEKIANFYNVSEYYRKIIDMTFLNQIGGSSLTDNKLEVSKYQGDTKEIPTSYVPFRNTHIIAMAVSWAEVLGAKKIYIGANYEDSPGYPDCRPEYYAAYNELIKKGTKNGDILIETPIIMFKKKKIVRTAIELNAPLELTWSCYAREDIACGECDSCALRLRGFDEAGISDPIDYIK